MTIDDFRQALAADSPPAVSALLQSMWHDAKGDWNHAHRLAQDVSGGDGAWVHAYLHRKEGDLSNAGYWYRQAGRAATVEPLEVEWTRIVDELLTKEQAGR